MRCKVSDRCFNQYGRYFHAAGLKRAPESYGYGGPLFLDYLTKLYGRELIPAILKSCRRQGPLVSGVSYNPNRCSFKALAQGVSVRAVEVGVVDSTNLAVLWKMYVEELFLFNPPRLDPRIDRRKLIPLKSSDQTQVA